MNLFDFFIIYLACGAPFGVYYFLRNAAEIPVRFFRLKTVLVFFFWMPFAFRLLRRNKIFEINRRASGKTSSADAQRTKTLHSVQKQIEKILLESDLKISIYEFREIVERYVGLTVANQDTHAESLPPEAEIYRVTQAQNVELSSICFSRRNRNRLSFHQIEARKDFLRLVERLAQFGADNRKLADASFQIVQNLSDSEAAESLGNIFADRLPTVRRRSVEQFEKDLWKQKDARRPQPAKSAPLQLSNTIATINLRKKD